MGTPDYPGGTTDEAREPQRAPPSPGDFVKVNVARQRPREEGVQQNRWRPAIVVRVWMPETINAVALLDGINDSAYGGVGGVGLPDEGVIKLTTWITSATHGFHPQQWCWPHELDAHFDELEAQAPIAADPQT